MLIGCIGDFHLGHQNIDKQIYINILNNLQNIHNVDFIVDGGDLVDRSLIDANNTKDLYDIFSVLDIPYHYVRGNHDSLNNTTVAQLLSFNKNITIHNEISKVEDILYIPYTSNITDLFKQLNEITTKQGIAIYAFSHLNITSNIYADISFDNLNKLHKYSQYWFNSHIHTPEVKESIFGTFYNIGSCSSLTFGDNHIPCYSIFDTETNKLTTFSIPNSVIHCCFNLKNENIIELTNTVLNKIEDYSKNYKLRCKFYLPNTENSIKLRETIRNTLKSNLNVIDVVFDYTKTEKQQIKEEKQENINKLPLVNQLINYFESDTNIILHEDIKKDLI